MSRDARVRRGNARSRSPYLLIMGNGLSEKRYFDNIRKYIDGYRVISIASGETGIENIVSKVDGTLRYSDIDMSMGDRIIIVTDMDDRYTCSQMESLAGLCRHCGYELYLSNPCFESWLILHYILNRKGGSASDMVDLLEDAMHHSYSKGDGRDPDLDMVRMAVSNARRIQGKDECTPIWCIGHNPSTMVHELVGSICTVEAPGSAS